MAAIIEERREELAERIVSSLDEGIIPWQKEGLPDSPLKNAISGRSYSGHNVLYLIERCAEKGYTDPRFVTASDAKRNGLYIRKGEQGIVLEYWAQGEDGKLSPRGYSVFNVEQLNKQLPQAELKQQDSNLEKVAELLRNAGIEVSPRDGVREYREAIKNLTLQNAVEMGLEQQAHTPDLLALRCSIASTMVMREVGIPVEQTEGAPLKSWSRSIKNDFTQLSKAARDSRN